MDYVKKNGLLYTEDLRTIVGVDGESSEFTGRVPFGVHYIEDEVFAGCTYDSISLPDSVEQMGACLFENAKNLTKIKLPANITELSPYMFSGCSKLYKVTLPVTISAFPEGLFNGCASLPEIPFRAGIKELPELVCAGCSSIQSVIIPATVQKIGNQAFSNCKSLATVILPAQIQEIAEDAFEGCDSIRNLRLSDDNQFFYIGEDGCLYERALSMNSGANDKCIIKIASIEKPSVSFFEENLKDEPDDENEFNECSNGSNIENRNKDEKDYKFFADENYGEGIEYEDDTFSPEVGMETEKMNEMTNEKSIDEDLLSDILGDSKFDSGEESSSLEEQHSEVGISADELALVLRGSSLAGNTAENTTDKQEKEMDTSSISTDSTENKNNSDVDAIFADIMGDEKARTDNVSDGVAVSEKESQVLADMMDCMSDKTSASETTKNSGKVSDEELEKLFSSHESTVLADKKEENSTATDDPNQIDSRTQILLDSAQLNKVIICEPAGEAPFDADLFVISELTAIDPDSGEKTFTPKLEKCCRHFAHIQDFKRIIMLHGLPVENDEFMQFFYHYMSMRNVIVACEAPSPSKLSAYARTICDSSRISLEKNDLLEQRKKISIKNSTLIKLVIQDFRVQ